MSYITEWSPLPAQEHRQLRYKRRFKEDCPTWDDSMVFAKNELAKHLIPDSTAVDLGCGHGNYLLDELRSSFEVIIGLDLDQSVAAHNSTITELRLINGDTWPVESNSVDVVTALWVLEHLENPAQTFSEVSRILKPGGLFVFTTPNKHSWLVTARRLLPYALAKRLVERLYGRPVADVFPVYYRANTLADLTRLLPPAVWTALVKTTNTDPSYTSFSELTYKISRFLAERFPRQNSPHLIGIFQKNP